MLANMQKLEAEFDELDAGFDDQLNLLLAPNIEGIDALINRPIGEKQNKPKKEDSD